ncbi:hypothetical protein L1280_003037 [Deinococcus sp. HSC-46F16]|uniref:hypothetical protein n=1 Tax=Deinococcus sp. HSC-46F16 TaxID=2910968 RepID=UPI00209CC181|nr:hypothetical protein [Deinococcus sp. HSC-46F16]MCP2015857.1 hypothetical protein [Deinococcus sp. HSC-46F16]
MLDNIFDTVRRGAERVQRRGEEVAQTARLRMEVFGLTRELDTLYARLGRAYHAGADAAILAGIQDDLRRVDEEISARERLIAELSAQEGGEEGGRVPTEGISTPDSSNPSPTDGAAGSGPDNRPDFTTDRAGTVEPTIPDAMPRPDESSRSS